MLVAVNTSEILAALDTEIARLRQARSLIAGASHTRGPGRPPASSPPAASPQKHRVSAAGRKRIAEAQRKRWAAQKKQKPMQVTRVPAKHAPKRKLLKRAVQAKTALSGRVPKEPVAAPAKAKDE